MQASANVRPTHVVEVDLDEAGDVDVDVDGVAEVADVAAHGVAQHVVGMREGLLLHHVVAHHLEQLLVEQCRCTKAR